MSPLTISILKAIKRCLRTRQWNCNFRPHTGFGDKDKYYVWRRYTQYSLFLLFLS